MVKTNEDKFDAALVFAAACAAFRINTNQYAKFEDRVFDADGKYTVKTRRNIDIMRELIMNPDQIQRLDHDMGEKMRDHFKGMMFKVLSGKAMNDFDLKGMTLANQELITAQNFGLIAYLPKKYDTDVQRQTINDRVSYASGGYIEKLGDKITRTMEVLRTVYSQQYNCFFVTAVTEQDEAVFFSFKHSLDQGSKITVKGTVKSHRDNQTQLNRVKLV